jgi:uncharacterized protein (DUF1778 family)
VGQERGMTEESVKRVESASRRTPKASEMTKLSAHDSRVFVQALSEPTLVNERLRETIKRYREATGR